jgi:hypothetical protein
MSKFLRVTVTRSESTELYVQVPDDFRPEDMLRYKYREELGRIAIETTDRSDWDNYAWPESIEVQGVVAVDAETANEFMVGTLRLRTDVNQ